MNIKVLTLIPEAFPGPLNYSIIGRALQNKLWDIQTIDMKQYTENNKRVDDYSFGDVAGMTIKAEVIDQAISNNFCKNDKLIYVTPRGRQLTQNVVKTLTQQKSLFIICGRYEGIDQRVIDKWEMDEISVGDFIMTGGECAAISIIDSVIRLLPGVINNNKSLLEESFENNLLEYPVYTRPFSWQNLSVPEVLTSGNHKRIIEWKKKESEEITKLRRPDMWSKYRCTVDD